MNNNELTHWGIKGQKWGIRKYQNLDGTLTPEGKKRYGKDSKPGEKQRPTKQKIEARREKIMRSDSAIKVYENTNLFTTEELERLYRRLNTKDKILQLTANEAKKNAVKKGKTFIEKMDTNAQTMKHVSDAIGAGIRTSKLFL